MRLSGPFWVACLAFCAVLGAGSGLAAADELLPADRPLSEVIDHYVAERIAREGIEPAPPAGDAAFIRRLTLDLAGRIPTAAEVREYVEAADSDKRVRLVDRLLDSPDFAYHHRNELDTLLLGDKGSDNEFRRYLLQAAREDRPWDQLFREMLTGEEEDEEAKGALAFLKKRARNLDDLTNDVSRIFFGVSINCAQCHDHLLVDDWKQDHYYGFQSFFSRTYLTKKNTLAEKHGGSVTFKTTSGEEKQARFMFLTGAAVEEPAVEKSAEQLKALEEEVQLQLKDENAPPPTPPAFSPRAELVRLALEPDENAYLARAIVNRLWARCFGQGLVDPPDQVHSGNPASHPELLDWLTRDLIAHDYRLKRVLRGIVLSDAYARSSRWSGPGDPPHPRFFAVAVPRPLSPRQYAVSLLVAASNPESFPGGTASEEWRARREGLENAANGLAGFFEAPGEHFQVSVDEALLFSNSEQIQNELFRASSDRLVGYLNGLSEPTDRIRAAFLAVLSREPEADEADVFETYLEERSDRPVDALQQMVWALITSPELRFNY